MGLNTTVVVLNDALSEIERDPDFGKNLAEAIRRHTTGHPHNYVPACNYVNAATVIETHHSSERVLVSVGGNTGSVVEED